MTGPGSTVAALWRFPVKSLLGEALEAAEVEARGLVGDRAWCVRTEDGHIGSGKSTRRFRRVDRLLDLRAASDPAGGPPSVQFPRGAVHRVGTPAADEALRTATGRQLTFARESGVPHHDEGPVHVLTTASLRTLSAAVGAEVDPRRFRASVLLDTPALDGLPETAWQGRRLALGPEVLLEVGYPMPRCVMASAATADLPADSRVLKAVHAVGGGDLGVVAAVLRGGTVRVGDAALLL
jgi:uncharacterized protein YcbX